MRTLDQVIGELPAARRAKIEARATELISEERALRRLRKAMNLTQERMAELLHVGQDSVSRLEGRSDMLISTLQSYVEAMGGTLKLVVDFPHTSIVLASLGEGRDVPQRKARRNEPRKKPRGRGPAAKAQARPKARTRARK